MSKPRTRQAHLAAALPLLVLALAFFWPLVIADGGLFWLNTAMLGAVMQLEFVVVVSGGFLFMPLLIPVERRFRVRKAIQRLVVLALALSFCLMAHALLGWGGVLGYVGLTYATFGGAFLGHRDSDENAFKIVEMVLRWVLYLVLFAGALAVTGPSPHVEGWGRNSEILPAGLLYFSLLGALELSGVFGLLWRLKRHE